MSRTAVSLREATADDASFLAELWADVLRRADRQDQVADLEIIIKDSSESSEQRLVVAEYDGEPAGAVLVRIGTMSPIDLEPCVQALAPHVLPSFRRKGVGRMLMDAAVTWAEELGIAHVATSAPASSRQGNRFMARLSLGPLAVFRVASTQVIRAKLTAQAPRSQRTRSGRPVGQVLAARRSLRHSHRNTA
jgi:GNAT superfamily N-acetyltransferase